MSSQSFLVEPLGFKYRIILSENTGSLAYSFPIYIPFTSLSCLVALLKSLRIICKRSGESDSLVPFLM